MCAAALGVGLLIAGATSYEAALMSEGRAGATAPSAPVAGELEVAPSIALATAMGHANVSAQYNPRFLQAAGKLDLLHRGHAAADWRMSHTQRALAVQAFTYGTFDFSPTGGDAARSRLNPRLPPVRFVNLVSSMSSVGFEQAISRRLGTGVSAGYLVTGGADAQARAYLPLEHALSLSTRVVWKPTKRDSLGLLLTGERSRFSNGTEGQLATAIAGWQRDFSRSTLGDASIGLSLGRTLGASRDLARTQVSPVAGAGILHRLAQLNLVGALRLSLGATIDRLSGAVYTQADGSASLEYSPNRQLMVSLRAAYSRALNGPAQGASVTRAELGALLALGGHVRLGTFVRTAWQSYGSGSALQGPAWATVLSMTVSGGGRL